MIIFSLVHNAVVPLRLMKSVFDGARDAVDRAADNEQVLPEDEAQIVRGAASAALQSPGYGTHLDFAVGVGYRLDVQGRVGNGIYGLALRRGFQLASWDAALGVRGAYNSGASVLSFIDDLNEYAKISEMKRGDFQLFGQVGREWGDWFRLWFGPKVMASVFSSEVDLEFVGEKDELGGTIMYYGGFFGLAAGYRWIHFLVEVSVLYADGPRIELFDYDFFEIDGPIIAPSWGLMATF